MVRDSDLPGRSQRTLPSPPDEESDNVEIEQDSARLVMSLTRRAPLVPGMRISLASTDEVFIGRGPHRTLQRSHRRVDVTIDDDEMSRRHLRLRPSPNGWELADAGSTNGTRVNGQPSRRATIADGDVIEVGSTMFLFRDDGPVKARFGDIPDRDQAYEPDARGLEATRTLSLDLERRLLDLTRIARSQLPLFIRGETGTGKELIARAVHDLSGRRGAFTAINCGALPRTLVESELFGFRRGAFSGAVVERDGLVRRAHGGTLFLDEIAELPSESQVALLRVLQEAEVRPLGAGDALAVDVRVVAATHQDIPARIAAGHFRQDLYARLAGFEFTLPPLRDRREDLGSLIAGILRRIGPEAAGVTFDRRAARALLYYDYPLNIRELEQALRAAVVITGGGQIRAEHLPRAMRAAQRDPAIEQRAEERALREELRNALEEAHGNVSEAARRMNKAPIQIRRWCRRFALDLASFRR